MKESRCFALPSNDLLCPADNMKHLDLFAGIGGFALAAKWLNWQTVGFVEKDEFCQKILRKNFGETVKIVTDIHDVTAFSFRQPDIITGGFPCQPFSQAGKRRGNEDDRALWSEMFRVIKAYKPRWIVGENVANFAAMELDNCLLDLENAGYETMSFVLPACAVNAPQRRDRIWIIANTNGDGFLPKQIYESTGFEKPIWNEFKFSKLLALEKSRYAANGGNHGISNGIPVRLDEVARLKGLGNSIVPQVAYEILSAIRDVDCQRTGT